MQTVVKVMLSLVSLNSWTIKRFDVQAYDYGHGIEGYAGYLDVVELNKRIVIHHDGSFEYSSL